MSFEMRRHLRQIAGSGTAAVGRPWDLEVDGKRWSVATDGRMLLAVDPLFLPMSTGKLQARAPSLIKLEPPLHPFSLLRLKAWCGKVPRWVTSPAGLRLSFRAEGFIQGVPVDRARLAKLLEPFRERETVMISVRDHRKPVVIAGAAFRAVLAPLTPSEADAGAPRLEVAS